MNKQILIVLVSVTTLGGCSGTVPTLGVNNGALLSCPKSPNCVNSQATDEEHFIEPLHYTGTQQEARNRLVKIIESEKRAKILIVQDNYVLAEFTSALFRFVDDVEFYFPEKQADDAVIHIRSASRVGYSDLGANRNRIEQIRSQFND